MAESKTKHVNLPIKASVDFERANDSLEPWSADSLYENTGIVRDGGVTNLSTTSYADSTIEEIYYTKGGKKVVLNWTGYVYGGVYVDGIQLGIVSQKGVTKRTVVPQDADDCMVSSGGFIAVKVLQDNLLYPSIVLTEYDTAGVFVATRSITDSTFGAHTFIKAFFVRKTTSVLADIKEFAVIENTAGVISVSILNDATLYPVTGALPTNYSQIYCAYSHGYIVSLQDRNNKKVFVFKNDGTQEGTFTAATMLSESEDSGAGIPLTFRGEVEGDTAHEYYTFTPPVADGASWTITPTALAVTSIYAERAIFGGKAMTYLEGGVKKLKTPAYDLAPVTYTELPEIRTRIATYRSFQATTLSIYLNTVDNAGSYLSASAQNYNKTVEDRGVPITEIGEIDENYLPFFSGTRLIYRRSDGTFKYLQITTAAEVLYQKRLQEIAPGIVSINTISAYNIVDTNRMALVIGANDYNGQLTLGYSAGAYTGTKRYAAVVRGTYGGGVDVGEKIVNLVSADLATLVPYVPDMRTNYSLLPIDIYIDGAYLYTWDGFAKRIEINKAPIYVEDTAIPAPKGTSFTDLSINLDQSTAIRSDNREGYTLGNEIAGIYKTFILFGRLYIYDGFKIQYVPVTNGVPQAPQYMTEAVGLTYLTTSPSIAYFFSTFDNGLYTYDGGMTLTKVKRFAPEYAITRAVFNTRENTLYLYSHVTGSDKIIMMRDGIMSEWTASSPTVTSTYSIFNTINGVYHFAQNARSGWKFTYAAATYQPLAYRTQYMGIGSRARQTIDRYLIRIFKVDKAAASLVLTHYVFDEEKKRNETQTFSLGSLANPYDADGYAYVEFVPTLKSCIGSSIRLQCTLQISILEVIATVTQEGSTTIKNRK